MTGERIHALLDEGTLENDDSSAFTVKRVSSLSEGMRVPAPGLSFLAIDCESAEPFRAMSATSPPVSPSRLATVPQMPGSRDHCLPAL